MTSTTETTSALRPLGQELSSRLGRFGQLVRRHLLIAGAARVVAQGALIVLACFWLDKWFRLGRPARFILLVAAIAWLAREAWQHIIRPMRARFGLVDLAAAVDRAAGAKNGSSLAPRVATVLELPELLRTSTPPSPAMVERAVQHAADTLRGVDFTQRLDERRYKLNLGSIGVIVFVLVLLAATNHALAGLWLRRWFAGSNEPWPQRTHLQIAGLVDGRLIVPRGEPFLLRVGVRNGAAAPENVELVLREKGASKVNASMTRFGPGDFRYDVPPVQQPITVEAEGGDDDFGPFVIDPVDRPRMANLALVSQHPTEQQPTTHTFAGQEADFSFLPKTKLELTFGANVPVADAIVKGPTTAPSVSDLRRIDDRHFAIAWTHDKPVQLQIEFVGKEAKLSSLPTPVTIGLKTDQAPRVTLSYTGVRQRITPNATIPLTVVARDDYGVAKVELASKAEMLDADKQVQTSTTSLPLFGPATKPISETDVQNRHDFAVAALKLPAGALLSLNATATDDCYGGAQLGASRPVTFRIVAPEELFREILLRQQGERARFRKQIEQEQQVRDALAALTSSETTVELSRKHKAVQREVLRVGNTLAESITEMRLNALGGAEAYDLMDKNVLKPLKAMDVELMNPQKDALDALGRGDDASKLAEAVTRQDQIVARMQEILKQMSQWDSFVDVLNQLNEIIRLQEQVKTKTDTTRQKQADSVFDDK